MVRMRRPSLLFHYAEEKHHVVRMSTAGSSTMDIDSYAIFSKNQYDAHRLTRDLLEASMKRLAIRCKLEDEAEQRTNRQRRLIADLGSADGSSSLATLDFAVASLQRNYNTSDGSPLPLNITFEEHPASDKEKLKSTLEAKKEWFERNDIRWSVLMKSFYEPLFERESVDFLMSYICLHWLDTTAVPEGENISHWKSLGDEDKAFAGDWVQINEATTPVLVQEAWRSKLASDHLAKFLALRAREMKPGSEMLLVMVGHPHDFVTLPDGGPGLLTRAMNRCINRGELRREVLDRTVVPYFLRTTDDVIAAVKIAETLEIKVDTNPERIETPGSMLSLVECRSIAAVTRSDGDGTMDGIFDLYWSIHVNSVQTANPSDDELVSIKTETRRIFDEVYDAKDGVPSTFVACTLRRNEKQ